MKTLASLLLAMAVVASAAQAADTYSIDPVSSIPVFQVLHLGFVTQRGRFDHVTGKLTLDLARHQGSVEFTIDTPSLDMGSAAWNAHLADAGLFNTAAFPTITFKSDQFIFEGDTLVGADGTLSIIGISRKVHLTVQRFRCGPHPQTRRPLCGGDVNATIRRSDFGMTRYLDAVSDEVRIDAPVLAYRD
jgi:polyisoprenoid-binding protein YceI